MARYDPDRRGYRIFVGNLSSDTNHDNLAELFRSHGPIVDIWLASNPPGFGFVVFRNADDAAQAVLDKNNCLYKGKVIKVQHARLFRDRTKRKAIGLSDEDTTESDRWTSQSRSRSRTRSHSSVSFRSTRSSRRSRSRSLTFSLIYGGSRTKSRTHSKSTSRSTSTRSRSRSANGSASSSRSLSRSRARANQRLTILTTTCRTGQRAAAEVRAQGYTEAAPRRKYSKHVKRKQRQKVRVRQGRPRRRSGQSSGRSSGRSHDGRTYSSSPSQRSSPALRTSRRRSRCPHCHHCMSSSPRLPRSSSSTSSDGPRRRRRFSLSASSGSSSCSASLATDEGCDGRKPSRRCEERRRLGRRRKSRSWESSATSSSSSSLASTSSSQPPTGIFTNHPQKSRAKGKDCHANKKSRLSPSLSTSHDNNPDDKKRRQETLGTSPPRLSDLTLEMQDCSPPIASGVGTRLSALSESAADSDKASAAAPSCCHAGSVVANLPTAASATEQSRQNSLGSIAVDSTTGSYKSSSTEALSQSPEDLLEVVGNPDVEECVSKPPAAREEEHEGCPRSKTSLQSQIITNSRSTNEKTPLESGKDNSLNVNLSNPAFLVPSAWAKMTSGEIKHTKHQKERTPETASSRPRSTDRAGTSGGERGTCGTVGVGQKDPVTDSVEHASKRNDKSLKISGERSGSSAKRSRDVQSNISGIEEKRNDNCEQNGNDERRIVNQHVNVGADRDDKCKRTLDKIERDGTRGKVEQSLTVKKAGLASMRVHRGSPRGRKDDPNRVQECRQKRQSGKNDSKLSDNRHNGGHMTSARVEKHATRSSCEKPQRKNVTHIGTHCRYTHERSGGGKRGDDGDGSKEGRTREGRGLFPQEEAQYRTHFRDTRERSRENEKRFWRGSQERNERHATLYSPPRRHSSLSMTFLHEGRDRPGDHIKHLSTSKESQWRHKKTRLSSSRETRSRHEPQGARGGSRRETSCALGLREEKRDNTCAMPYSGERACDPRTTERPPAAACSMVDLRPVTSPDEDYVHKRRRDLTSEEDKRSENRQRKTSLSNAINGKAVTGSKRSKRSSREKSPRKKHRHHFLISQGEQLHKSSRKNSERSNSVARKQKDYSGDARSCSSLFEHRLPRKRRFSGETRPVKDKWQRRTSFDRTAHSGLETTHLPDKTNARKGISRNGVGQMTAPEGSVCKAGLLPLPKPGLLPFPNNQPSASHSCLQDGAVSRQTGQGLMMIRSYGNDHLSSVKTVNAQSQSSLVRSSVPGHNSLLRLPVLARAGRSATEQPSLLSAGAESRQLSAGPRRTLLATPALEPLAGVSRGDVLDTVGPDGLGRRTVGRVSLAVSAPADPVDLVGSHRSRESSAHRTLTDSRAPSQIAGQEPRIRSEVRMIKST